MPNNNIDIHLIDEILLDRSSKESGDNKKDSEVQDILEQQRLIRDAFILEGRSAIKTDLKQIHQKIYGKEKGAKWIKYLFIILLLGIIGATYFLSSYNTKTIDQEMIFAENYESYELSKQMRGGTMTLEHNEIFSAYKNKNFREVIQQASRINIDRQAEIQLLVAISHFESKDHNSAIEVLNKMIDQSNPFFKDHAMWYKGLFLTKEGNVDAAQKIFTTIKLDTASDYFEEASNILDQF